MERFKPLVLRIFNLFVIFLTIMIIVFIGLFTYDTNSIDKIVNIDSGEWQPKDVLSELDNMPLQVKEGYFLTNETPKYMGPMAEDERLRFTGNNLTCTNCHINGGSQAGSASWVGVIERFPQFGGRANKMGTIEDRINGCMERSMNGKKLPLDSKEIKAIVSYMKWLGEGLPEGRKEEFKGYAPIKIPDVAVDLVKGKDVYANQCITCHGKNGEGLRYGDAEKGYQYPPLWGNDSYNDGAGMNRVITAAEFIKGNMPFGQATWDNPKLTDEEAFNVAGYINSFDRPKKDNTEDDYPDKKLKPVSTPYGPWADDFSAEQHKFGPFSPIIIYYKDKYGILKTK